MAGIYKAYDVRGIYPDEINEQIMEKVTIACLSLLKEKGLLQENSLLFVGRDVRDSSPGLSEIAIQTIIKSGYGVADGGVVPTDAFYHALSTGKYAGGLMITASHNPPQYNGVKFVAKGVVFVSGEELEVIASQLTDDNYDNNDKKGEVRRVDIIDDFVEYSVSLGSLKEIKKEFKIVFDPGNGTAAAVLPKILPKMKVKSEIINIEMDGRFPGRGPDPAKNCEELKNKVIDTGADFGVAWDNDSDRIIFVDDKGEVVPGDITLAVIAKAVLEKKNTSVVYDVLCSRSTVLAIEESGGQAIESKVGRFNISRKMAELDAFLGGEASGHYYFKFGSEDGDWYTENTWFTLFNLMQILDKSEKTLSDLVAEVTKYHKSDIINFEVADSASAISKLAEKYNDGQQSTLDGLKVSYDNWWFLVRPSNTEPIIRMVVEADKKESLGEKIEELKGIIQSEK